MTLHKSQTPVVPFLMDCVNLFVSEAKAKGILLSYSADTGGHVRPSPRHGPGPGHGSDPGSGAGAGGGSGLLGSGKRGGRDDRASSSRVSVSQDYLVSLPLREDDIVDCDKFKLAQVYMYIVTMRLSACA